jgi:hypothetical protein
MGTITIFLGWYNNGKISSMGFINGCEGRANELMCNYANLLMT